MKPRDRRPKPALALPAAALLAVILVATSACDAPVKNANPTGETIVCFGDSLTYGTGGGSGGDYPSQLARLVGRPVINLGVPGDTTAKALARIDTVLERNPRMVLLTLGGNDLKNRVARATAFANLHRIVSRIQAEGALVVIGGLTFPVHDRGFGRAYKELAEETGSVLVPNVYSGIMGKPGLMSDPIHPNAQGYAIMARHFYDAIAPYL
jgi:acyl-CoA thioesterase-1